MQSDDDSERPVMYGWFHGQIRGVKGIWHFHVRQRGERMVWLIDGGAITFESAVPEHLAGAGSLLDAITNAPSIQADIQQAV